jgi:hypothetical protein
MKYIVELNGERREVDINGPRAQLNGHEVAVRLDVVEGTPVRLVRVGDEVHRVVVRRNGGRGRYTQ